MAVGNIVSLIGRLTKDPEVRYSTGEKQTAIARFNLAVDRERDKDTADFISCVAFGKTAEFLEKYITKGRMIAVAGRIQTGSYEKDGHKVYTTDVVCESIKALDRKQDKAVEESQAGSYAEATPDGFQKLQDDDIPF